MALRRTSASCFGAEAFEERELYGIDHLSGDMAVLVHARFDDAMELANGVFTITLASGRSSMDIDTHPGAVSVTNPPDDHNAVSESRAVAMDVSGALRVPRFTHSSEAKGAAQVYSSVQLISVFRQARAFAEAELSLGNGRLPPARQRASLVLDFEFCEMADGWTGFANGEHGRRFVLKQMRPLEPSIGVPETVRGNTIPQDVLARGRRIERYRCDGPALAISWRAVLTDSTLEPDVGYSVEPQITDILFSAPRVGGPGIALTHLNVRASGSAGKPDVEVLFSEPLPYAAA